ncbi:MAG: transglycosylase SLT domain-containing protein [Acidimicrobiia bacterium]
MSMSRSLGGVAVAAALLITSLPAGGVAYAQTKSDVDKAQQEANSAKGTLSDAQNAANTAAATRDAIEADLLARQDQVQQTTAELDAVAADVARLRGQIEDTELTVKSLRDQAEERAVEAYMNGWSTDIGVLALNSKATQLFILQDVIETQRSDDLAQMNELTIQRRVLDELRSDQETEQSRLETLQDDLVAQVSDLEDRFMQADVELRAAYLEVDSADRQYKAALNSVSTAQKAYEDAQRKIRIGSGVQRWRPLVAKYFPADLVEQALAVMQCESGGNPDAVNRYSGATGLFQFLKGTWAIASSRAGFGAYSRFDPEANIAAAAWLADYSIKTGHSGGAWGHWSCRP